MVDEAGQSVMSVGDQGFNAGESNTLNPDEPFEAPSGGDVAYHGDNEYQQEITDASLLSENTSAEDSVSDEESGWAGSDDDGGGDDGGGCSSCSSCSSCGGCD